MSGLPKVMTICDSSNREDSDVDEMEYVMIREEAHNRGVFNGSRSISPFWVDKQCLIISKGLKIKTPTDS